MAIKKLNSDKLNPALTREVDYKPRVGGVLRRLFRELFDQNGGGSVGSADESNLSLKIIHPDTSFVLERRLEREEDMTDFLKNDILTRGSAIRFNWKKPRRVHFYNSDDNGTGYANGMQIQNLIYIDSELKTGAVAFTLDTRGRDFTYFIPKEDLLKMVEDGEIEGIYVAGDEID